MFAINRAVQLKNFRVIEANLEYLDSDSTTQVFVDFDDYDINLEYKISEVEEDTLALTMSIAVNGDDEPEHGYSIYILGMMVFEVIDWDEDEEEEDYDAYIREAVQLGIGAIRGYIMNMTAFGLMGPYTLPNIDPDKYEEDYDDVFGEDDDPDPNDGVRNLNPNLR